MARKRTEKEAITCAAAAPKMKAALELALEVIDDRDIPVGDGRTSYNNIGVIIRTALAKAEGKGE